MKWFDKWFYTQVKNPWDSKEQHDETDMYVRNEKNHSYMKGMKMNTIGSEQMVDSSYPEGHNRISFELTCAVGGRILNVRRYDDTRERHDHQTYVIPSGEDVGARVAKIINLELIK